MDYFEILNDVELDGRWELGEPMDRSGNEIEPDQFLDARALNLNCVWFSVEKPGRPLDFTISYLDVPVVNSRCREAIELCCAERVQFIPAKIKDARDDYYVLNILDALACVDESKSEFMKWTIEDDAPEMLGRYRMISRLAIDDSKAMGRNIFRISGWEVAIVVSGLLKQALDQQAVNGILFEKA